MTSTHFFLKGVACFLHPQGGFTDIPFDGVFVPTSPHPHWPQL